MEKREEYVAYAHQQHKNFIDEMHAHFELANPLYVDDIQFRPLLTDGGYGSKPVIYINDFYLDPKTSPRFNRLNL